MLINEKPLNLKEEYNNLKQPEKDDHSAVKIEFKNNPIYTNTEKFPPQK